MDRRRRAARTAALMSLFTMADTQTDVPIASFVGDGSDLISLIVGIDPVQDLNGYDNPWPAGGGKNLLSLSSVSLVKPSQRTLSRDINTIPAGQYVFSWDVSGSSTATRMAFRTGSNVSDGQVSVNLNDSTSAAVTFTNPITNLYFYIVTSQADGVTAEINNMMVRAADDADSSFAPYENICPISGWTGANIHVSPTTDAADGNTYSINFPSSAGTVYGGTLDVTTGKLTVDRASFDLGNINWFKDSRGRFQSATPMVTGIKPASSASVAANILCSSYKTISSNQTYLQNIGISLDSSGTCHVFDSAYSDAASFKAAVTGQTIVYELATPIVYDLTPTQVTTLIGTNNIWADTGDIKYIEYNI